MSLRDAAFTLAAGAALLASCGARTGLVALRGRAASSAASASSAPSSSMMSAGGAAGRAASSGGFGGAPGSGGGGASATGAGGAGGACDPTAELVYVLDSENRLYRFDPPNKSFSLLYSLACPTSLQPNSMAVDRGGTAWINYFDFAKSAAGALYRVKIADGSCDPAPTPLPVPWYKVGMGFTADAPDKSSETLYLAGELNGAEGMLGRLDMATMSVVPIGSFGAPFAGKDAELTGNAKAELYAYFAPSAQIAEVDPASAKVLSVATLGLGPVGSYAFSYWGGDFYVYTANGPSSDVTRYDPAAHTVTPYLQDIGFAIVGAGVAPCAVAP